MLCQDANNACLKSGALNARILYLVLALLFVACGHERVIEIRDGIKMFAWVKEIYVPMFSMSLRVKQICLDLEGTGSCFILWPWWAKNAEAADYDFSTSELVCILG